MAIWVIVLELLTTPALLRSDAVDGAVATFATAVRDVFGTAEADAAEGGYSGDRIIVIDGDTIALPCRVPFPGCAEKVRILEIDAPESHRPGCEAELAAGLRAKERLRALLDGESVTIQRSGRDRYGRTLAIVRTPRGKVSDRLLAEQLVLPYRPGAAEKAARARHWCG
jgi:endonuclease YncB( thermonuclease family)